MKKKEHPDHSNEAMRLNRISGQIEGIKKMIQEKRYCIDIITQLRAIQSAAKSLETNILRKHLESCVKKSFTEDNKDKKEQKINELIQIFKKLD